MRDQRDAQDLQLDMLRQSLLDLAVAHGAPARGSNLDLNSAVALVQQELEATQALAEHFQSLKPTWSRACYSPPAPSAFRRLWRRSIRQTPMP